MFLWKDAFLASQPVSTTFQQPKPNQVFEFDVLAESLLDFSFRSLQL